MIVLSCLINGKRGGLFGMEGTQAFVATAVFLQGYMFTDYLNNVGGIFN